MKQEWNLKIPDSMYNELYAHLFPGDQDEHGAVIAAGMTKTADGKTHLLARQLFLATDGVDYLPGKRGYRMLCANFVRDRILECGEERLVYLAIHNHRGTNRVAFSQDDYNSHERGYPALLDIADGMPVGALVFAQNAVAADIWLPSGDRITLNKTTIVGKRQRVLYSEPRKKNIFQDETYDRQARIFGDAGQDILRQTKIGIIGLGGAGSLIAQYCARLGVGHFVLIDGDRVERSNLPRLVGATRMDALYWLTHENLPRWLRNLARRYARKKVAISKRVIKRANNTAKVEALFGNVLEPQNAEKLLDCDYIFLAADTMGARLLFNAIVYQYLIAGVQVGAKVSTNKETGEITDVFSIIRPVTPDTGCLWCNGLINPAKLQEEGQGQEELNAQRYIDEPDVVAPSVITLNAVAAAHAVNDFLFYITGLTDADATSDYMRSTPLERDVWHDTPQKSENCTECGKEANGRFAKGDAKRLPTFFKVKK